MIIAVLKYLCCFLSVSLLFASDLHLQEWLEKAKGGDYIVTEANKMVSLVCIRSVSEGAILIEEITAPLSNIPKMDSWSQWVKTKAPGATSWSMIEIDMKNGEILECYSFSKSSWMQLAQKESLIATLLQLPLQKVPAKKQKRIGPPPLADEPDTRKIWKPQVTFEGKKREENKFEVLETTWPHDETEISDKKITLYFDKDFPLPFWIQVEGSHGTAILRTIDGGHNLDSPYRSIPRRAPQFFASPEITEKGITLFIKCPKYFRDFDLFAVDVTHKEREVFPIANKKISFEGETARIFIERTDLNEILKHDHKYTWLLVPTGFSELYAESFRPFLYRPDIWQNF